MTDESGPDTGGCCIRIYPSAPSDEGVDVSGYNFCLVYLFYPDDILSSDISLLFSVIQNCHKKL